MVRVSLGPLPSLPSTKDLSSLQINILLKDGRLLRFVGNQKLSERDESLSAIKTSTFVPLPKNELQYFSAPTSKKSPSTSPKGTLTTDDLNAYINTLLDFPSRLLPKLSHWALTLLQLSPSTTSPTSPSKEKSHADELAFHQYWVALTELDTLVALDTQNTSPVWRLFVPHSDFYALKLLPQDPAGTFTLLVLGKKRSLSVDPLTGEYTELGPEFLDGAFLTVVSAPPAKGASAGNATLQNHPKKALLGVDKTLSAHTFPPSSRLASQVLYTLEGLHLGSSLLKGYRLNVSSLALASKEKVKKTEMWTLALPGDETIAVLPVKDEEGMAFLTLVFYWRLWAKEKLNHE